MTVREAIETRQSVRTYKKEAVDSEIMARLREMCREPRQCLPGQQARIVVIERGLEGRVGTYGIISGAQCCLALVYRDVDGLSAVNAGMVMENIVLWLTQQGQGTCWLGGTFSRSDVTAAASPAPDERIAAIVVLGIAADRERLVARVMRKFARSRRRRAFDDLFDIGDNRQWSPALELMRLAPSALNGQPWRAVAEGNAIHFFCTKPEGLGLLDTGIGLAHFAAGTDKPGVWETVGNAASIRPEWRYVISFLAE